jgi:hypothetical protein
MAEMEPPLVGGGNEKNGLSSKEMEGNKRN